MKLIPSRSPKKPENVSRVHVGAGGVLLPGWWNIDLKAAPGLDQVLDVRRGLPFNDLSFIYAEHFVEHLTLDEGLAFLTDCRRALSPSGVLRLSTPNLDWVILTHYHINDKSVSPDGVRDCLMINRAFHGWGHRFLYNREMLTKCLRAVGFSTLEFHRYGQSGREELQNIERHETYFDAPDLPHLVVVEATGRDSPDAMPEELLSEYRGAF